MSKDEIFQLIVRHTREVLPVLEAHDFKQTDSLKALGANSIDRADVIMLTLEALSLSIPMTAMARAENMGQLAGIIHEKI
jgi:polyketide biosynthesis acyl carrier protein